MEEKNNKPRKDFKSKGKFGGKKFGEKKFGGKKFGEKKFGAAARALARISRISRNGNWLPASNSWTASSVWAS